MSVFKNLGERCKFFEQNFGQGTYLMPQVPALCRIDGRAFHTFCRGLSRPYESGLCELMHDTLEFLMKETQAVWGYTQSDEISLCWHTDKDDSQIFFDGRRQKIESMTASLATYYFNKNLAGKVPCKSDTPAFFDSRVWSVPNKNEAVAYGLWRERDCTKNSITMSASAYYSHKELQGKNGADKQNMLHTVGVNWNDYPNFFKRGTFLRYVTRDIPFSASEIANLPEKHSARLNPSLKVTRKVLEYVSMPPFDKVTNKIGVLFKGEEPCLATSN